MTTLPSAGGRRRNGWLALATLPVHVEAAFYQTTWFYATLIAIAIAFVAAGWQFRVRGLRRQYHGRAR